MPTFTYTARRASGEEVTGTLQAENQQAVLAQLALQGHFPVRVEEMSFLGTKPAWKGGRRLSREAISVWTRQIADLLEAGVALPRALHLAKEQTADPRLAGVAQDIVERVRGGAPLSETLKSFPAEFPPLYISLVYAGEVGGTMPLAFGRLAEVLEQEDDFRSRVRAALAYPGLIAGVGLATLLFVMLFAVPRLSAMFVDLGQGMPLLTRLVTRVSDGMLAYGGWAAIAILGAAAVAWRAGAGPWFQSRWRRLWVATPLWGPVVRKSMIARFARTLATLLYGGVPIVDALRVVAGVLDHPEMQADMAGVARDVERGRSLSEALRQVRGFPVFACQMVAVGEEVNALEKSLNKVAAAYEREADRAMKVATSLIEPLMILVMGSLVGAIVLAMLLPIFQISAFVK